MLFGAAWRQDDVSLTFITFLFNSGVYLLRGMRAENWDLMEGDGLNQVSILAADITLFTDHLCLICIRLQKSVYKI